MRIALPSLLLCLLKFIVLPSIAQENCWVIPAQTADVQAVNWDGGPSVSSLPFVTQDRFASNGIAYNACGEFVFEVMHEGIQSPNHLFCIDKSGSILGPGLNSIRSSGEMEVIRVPNKLNEWYIIYSLYTDVIVTGGNPLYTAAELAYSRVYYDCESFSVLEQDVLIEADGVVRSYTHGKALSATAAGDPNAHFLYACRRPAGYNFLSVDRFLIDENGINWDLNSGDVPSAYWPLTIAGSPIELSADGNVLAVLNRDQDAFSPSGSDIYLFDAITLNLLEEMEVDKQLLQPDMISVFSPATPAVLSSTVPALSYLENITRKVSFIEFSPSGQYLYFGHGGYAISGHAFITYIGQIDLSSPAPHAMRIQAQQNPGGSYTASGSGCSYAVGTCLDDWEAINTLQLGPGGNIYFTKRNSDTLYVLPTPDDPMPQQILPGNVNMATVADPNIVMGATIGKLPDLIDGYDYSPVGFDYFELPISILECGDCIASPSSPQRVELYSSAGNLVKVVELVSCPDTMMVCLYTDSTYHLVYGALSIDNAVDAGVVNSPLLFELLDSTLVAELNGPQDFCLQDDARVFIGSPAGGFFYGNGITDSTAGTFDPMVAGIGSSTVYYVQQIGSCLAIDSITVEVHAHPIADAGPDHLIVENSSALLLGSGGPSYNWTPATNLDCSNCATPLATPVIPTWFLLTVENAFGCADIDSAFVDLYDLGEVFFPTAFTPNGDQLNDLFGPAYASSGCEVARFEIFNRWGERIFLTNEAGSFWDGTFQGKEAEIGTYIYLATFQCIDGQTDGLPMSETQLYKGTLTLLR